MNAFEVYFDRVLIVSVFDDEGRSIAQLKYSLIGFTQAAVMVFDEIVYDFEHERVLVVGDWRVFEVPTMYCEGRNIRAAKPYGFGYLLYP